MPDEEQTRQEPNEAETKSINFDTEITCEPEFITKEHINRVSTMFGLAEATAEVMANNVINSLIANMDTIINHTFNDFSDKLAEALTEADIDAIIKEEVGENASEEEKKNKKREIIKEKAEKILSENNKKNNKILQGATTNTLSRATTTGNNNYTLDIMGNATIKRGNVTVTIKNFQKLADYRETTSMLLDALVVEYTGRPRLNGSVSLPLSEYMKKRGLKDKKEARKQVKADLDVLYQMSIDTVQKINKKETNFTDTRIISDKGISNGIIQVTFSQKFLEILNASQTMYYPPFLQKIKPQKNPASYYIGRKLAEHKNMHYLLDGGDTIAVSTLLKEAPTIPSYEEVKNSDRAFSRRIISKLENALDAIKYTEGSDISGWEYCHSKGAPLTDKELKEGIAENYDTFSKLYIKVHWRYYPEQQRKEKAPTQNKGKNKAVKKKAPAKAKE